MWDFQGDEKKLGPGAVPGPPEGPSEGPGAWVGVPQTALPHCSSQLSLEMRRWAQRGQVTSPKTHSKNGHLRIQP